MRRLRRLLARRRVPLVGALIMLALASPALLSGEAVDDLYHRAVLRPEGPVAGAATSHGIFGFLDDDEARRRALLRRGVFPWWTGARTRVAFFRPLSELTHRLDHRCLGGRPALMHAQSLLWAALLVLAAGALYRRTLGRGATAGLAVLLFAVDDAHGLTFGWIANRNAILAALFGVLAIVAHDRWRRDGSRRAALLAPAWLCLSLLSGEAGVATLAYLVAHAMCLDRARGWRRLRALAPAAVVVVAWRLAITSLGYGVRGSGLYVDPPSDPIRFLSALTLRAPMLLAGQWGPVPSDVDGLLPEPWRPLGALLAALALAGLFAVLAVALRGDRIARFFAVGMTLAVVPVCATFPSDRLLVFVGLGAMGLLARALPRLLETRWRSVGVGLAFLHLVIAPALLPIRATTPAMIAGFLDPCMRPPPEAAGRHLVVIDALDVCPAYAPLRAALDGRPAPRRMHTLSPGVAPLELRREDARTLVVRREGGWFSTTNERVFWDPAEPWAPGRDRDLGGLRAIVRDATEDGRPREVAFRFDVPLEDASLRWARVGAEGELVPFAPPRVGAATWLEPAY